MTAPAEIDGLLLSFSDVQWRKVARVIAETLHTLEAQGVSITAEEVGARVERLVGVGRLEAQGDIENWRHSEVRLPPNSK